MKKGKFIVIEGVDGSGKTTQIPLIKEFIENKGINCISTLEPGGTKIGKKIREILLDPELKNMDNITELLLFNSARAQHVKKIINPALESGIYVICDRFSDSTLAYQGYGRGLDINIIKQINKISTYGLTPDMTIILDLPVEESINRNKKIGKADRLELESLEFYKKIRSGFNKISYYNDSIHIVDAIGTIEQVQKRIQCIIDEYLLKNKK